MRDLSFSGVYHNPIPLRAVQPMQTIYTANGALVSDGVDVAVFVTADVYREVNMPTGSAVSNAAMVSKQAM